MTNTHLPPTAHPLLSYRTRAIYHKPRYLMRRLPRTAHTPYTRPAYCIRYTLALLTFFFNLKRVTATPRTSTAASLSCAAASSNALAAEQGLSASLTCPCAASPASVAAASCVCRSAGVTSRGAAAAEGRTWGVGMREGDLEDFRMGLQAALGDGLLDIRGKTWVQRGHWLRLRGSPVLLAAAPCRRPMGHMLPFATTHSTPVTDGALAQLRHLLVSLVAQESARQMNEFRDEVCKHPTNIQASRNAYKKC